MMVWTAAATLALAGAAFGQNAPQQAGAQTQERARVHKPADGKGLSKEQAKMAKKQQKQAEKAQRKADKAAAARAKKSPGDGSGHKGARPKDGTGYGAKSGKRGGPIDGSRPQIGQGRGGNGSGRGGRGR